MAIRWPACLAAPLAAALLAGCQTIDGQTSQLDQECVQKQIGSRALSKAAGAALGLTGIPFAGKVAGFAVGQATNPNCSPVKTVQPQPGPRINRVARPVS